MREQLVDILDCLVFFIVGLASPTPSSKHRFTVRNMVESAAIRDISDASVYSG